MRFIVSLTTACVLATGCSSGSSCTVLENTDGTATIRCTDGTEVTIENGTDGTSCTVRDGGDGTRVIECDDGTSVTVTDGTEGPEGPEGPGGPDGRDLRIVGAGLRMEATDVGVGADRRPFVALRFTDASGAPLDREGVATAGAITASFTIARLSVESRVDGDVVLPFANYITRTVMSADGSRSAVQPAADSDGTWSAVDAADGRYRYTFGAVLPEDYPASATHRIGIYATRTVSGVRFVANATPTFRPDGAAVTVTRDIVTNEACNTCHSPISAHGGAREDVALCVTCHASGYEDPDTGNSLDFRTMVHRIHRGADLPSVRAGVPYQIIGFRGAVHDYSDVHFPQDIRNCQTCHAGPDGDRWQTTLSRAACGSCHNDTWFEEAPPPESWMHMHSGGERPDDTRCTVCHTPTGGLAPLVDSHFTKFQQPFAPDLAVAIHGATLTSTRNIRVDFTVTVNGTGRNLLTSPLTGLSAIVAGPTTDYLFNASFNMTAATAGTLPAASGGTPGRFVWTSLRTVDEIAATAAADALRTAPGIDASGTWAVGIQATLRVDGRATSTACAGSTATCTAAAPMGGSWGCVAGVCTEQFLYAAQNPVAYFAITGAVARPRREVVAIARCNECHEQLALHGGGRNNPELCVMCHNSTFDTVQRMPVPAAGAFA